MTGTTYVAFSGGKDSTAMALRLAELGEPFELFYTPTGNELPELELHVMRVAELIARPLHRLTNGTLGSWIESQNALPNWRQRWCTRLIKIEPCKAFLAARPGSTLCVGLRADEEERKGLYGNYAEYRYPLREWGWDLGAVQGYLREKGARVPTRTDCAVCPFQRLGEWYALWKNNSDEYQQGVDWEVATGHTFRSPSRDTWPASLADLRAEFEKGRLPRGVKAADQLDLFDDEPQACRVCRF